jgi:alkylated DNA repair dioxygenase AlkB
MDALNGTPDHGTEYRHAPSQASLFPDATPTLPDGAILVHEFLSREEQADLLEVVQSLELTQASYKQYTARRRVAAFGSQFDYNANTLRRASPIPRNLRALRDRVAEWCGVRPELMAHMLVSEYAAGTPLGWHRDVPQFESIVGLSLRGHARMKLRPFPPKSGRAALAIQVDLPPGSLYVLEGEARWAWQHCIVETKELRYSLTLRTPKGSPLLMRLRTG